MNRLFALVVTLVALAQFLAGCAAHNEVFREASKTRRPGWLTAVPRDDAEKQYFVGMCTGAATLEDGKAAAVKNAIAQIATFLRISITSNFEENSSEIDQKIRHQVTAKSAANVAKATVEDTYYERTTRSMGDYTASRVDVYVLMGYPKKEADAESQRHLQEQQSLAKRSLEAYSAAQQKERSGQHPEALKMYRKGLSLASEIDQFIEFSGQEVQDSDKLIDMLKAAVERTSRYIKEVDGTYRVTGSRGVDAFFKPALTEALLEGGLHVGGDDSLFIIAGSVATQESGVVMGNHLRITTGSLTVVNKGNGVVVATIPLRVKGFHQTSDGAERSSLIEAGKKAGEQIAAALLKEDM